MNPWVWSFCSDINVNVNASILSINKASTLDVFGDINVMKLSLVEIKCSHI